MKWFSVRINGGFVLILQAFFLQLVWSPDHNVFGTWPDNFALTGSVFLLLLAAVGFVFLRPLGWLLAMLAQAICLVTGLVFRFSDPALLVPAQLMMLYAIGAVLYLNVHTVRGAFNHSASPFTDPGGPE